MENDGISLGIHEVAVPGNKPKRSNASDLKSAAVYLMAGAFFFFKGVSAYRIPSAHPQALADVWLPIGAGAVACLLGFFMLFGLATFGGTTYQQVFDPAIEQRAQKRFAKQIAALTSYGFNYEFTSSETYSLSRFLLVYPALIFLIMWINRELLAVRGGKVLLATPVFSFDDGQVFAHPIALGVTFHTAFRNGPLLITKNYKSINGQTPEVVAHTQRQSLASAWAMHQYWVNKLEAASAPANRNCSYEAYKEIVQREDIFQKSQRQ